MNATTKNLVYLWVVGFCCLMLIMGFIIFVIQMSNVNTQYTQPGIADYQDGNYSKAIQELNTSIQRNGADRAAFYYLGLSLKKQGTLLAHAALSWTRKPVKPGLSILIVLI